MCHLQMMNNDIMSLGSDILYDHGLPVKRNSNECRTYDSCHIIQ